RRQHAVAGAAGNVDRDRRIDGAALAAMGARSDGTGADRQSPDPRHRRRARAHPGRWTALCVWRLRRRRSRAGQRKLATPDHRHRAGRKQAYRPRQSAGLSFAAFAGGGRRLLAHGVHRAHPARRIRAARKRLSAPHDERNRSGILDRTKTEIPPVVPRTDAGCAHQDHGRGQAVGSATLLRPDPPTQCGRTTALRAAQPGRRHQPRHRGGGRNEGVAIRARQGAGPPAANAGGRDRAGIARMTDIVLALRNATKLYAGVPAIENVDFELRRGEIHALVGENGAGKSTLTKVMAGVVTLSSGTMQVNGVDAAPRTPLEARHLGIAMVFQENSLVPTMTVAQNLFLGQERFYNRLRGIYIAAQQFLQSLNFDVTPTATVGLLGAAKKQMVE